MIVAGVTVDADAASRGSLTIADGSTVYTCHAQALRVWGDLTVAGTPGGGVRFTTGGTNTPTGYGLQFDNTYGVSDLQHCRFDFMARGISIADAKTNTATVRAGGCVFSNLTERAIQIHNSPGVATLAMSNSLVTACEESLYAYNGGQVAFAGTDFLDSGPVYGASGSQVDFEDCNFHELDVYPESGFFPKSHTSLGGPGGGFTLRHCTVAGNRGCGIRVTESGGAELEDCIVWNNEFGSFGEDFGGSYTARTSCVQGTYPAGVLVDCLTNAPGFVGWSGGLTTVYVNAASPCPGAGTAGAPYCSLAHALETYRANFDFGLAAGSPCLGAGSGGSDMGADNGTGSAGVTAVAMQVAAGTYGLGGGDLLLDVSVHGADPETVVLTNTIRGLRDGAVLEGVTVAGTEGMGVEIKGPVSPVIRDCIFRDLTDTGINIDLSYGWEEETASPEIAHCRIFGVTGSPSYTYGVQVRGNSWNLQPRVRNCLFTGMTNVAAALHAEEAGAVIESCTVAGNAGPGAQLCNLSRMDNCVLYGNTADLQGAFSWSSNRPVLSNSLYGTSSGYYRTNDCLELDPRFVDDAGEDFRLSGYSPCLGSGTNQDWMAAGVDLDGNPRLAGDRVDMGAYEYQGPAVRVSPTNQYAYCGTGTVEFTVASVGTGTIVYEATTADPWLEIVEGATGTNSGTITVRREANLDFTSRTGTIRVAGSGVLRLHTVVQAGGGAPAWDDGYTDLGGGWRRLGWFGDYAVMALEGWIWHNQHGFFFVSATSTPGEVWLFANDMGWLYTGNTLYPFLFQASDSAWIWYNGATNPRWFMNFTSGQWESRP